MTATSCDGSHPSHKMWGRAIGVDSAKVAGVGFAGTKATRPADPVSVTTGGSTGHLERLDDATPPRVHAQPLPDPRLRAACAPDCEDAVIPAACCAAPVCAGAKAVLMHLWKYASKWYPGDGPRFVWPSVERLAVELGRKLRGVYANLATLETAGWIVRDWDDAGRKGWTLNPIAAPPVAPEMQLGFAWDDGPPLDPANDDTRTISDAGGGEQPAAEHPSGHACETSPAASVKVESVAPAAAAETSPTCAQPVERIDRVAPECNSNCTGVQLPKRKEEPMNNQPPHGRGSTSSPSPDEGVAIFRAYEQRRIAKFGDRYPLRSTPPMTLWNLWRELGGNASAWRKVEAYGKRAIDIAAKAVESGHEKADQWVKLRADGGEWARARYDAVMAWQGAGAEPQRPTPPPPPDPTVDGERVHMLEREAWDSGGEEAVRMLRREALAPERMAAMAGDFLAKLRTA